MTVAAMERRRMLRKSIDHMAAVKNADTGHFKRKSSGQYNQGIMPVTGVGFQSLNSMLSNNVA